MKTRKLGKTGIETSAIGLGAMSFTNFYGPCSDTQSAEVLSACLDMGVTHIDTSNVYGMGVSEQRIGGFLSQQGQQKDTLFSIATKAGICRDPETGTRGFNNEAVHLEEELDKSLARMGVDCVDLFYVHRRQQEIPIEEVAGSLGKLVEKGKIKSFGFSEIAPSSLRRAHAVHPVAAVQSEYSLSTRNVEMGMLQACAELGTTLVAFSPVGRTFLTDTPMDYERAQTSDFLKGNPRFLEPNITANLAITDKFRAYAGDYGLPTASLAIAWLLAQGEQVLPIPGTRSVEHLKELVKGCEIELTAQMSQEIEDLLPIGWAHGDRYSAAQWIGPERYC
jgi:aryl-alcohol dehydrogenase-like predicted oxidoreductase